MKISKKEIAKRAARAARVEKEIAEVLAKFPITEDELRSEYNTMRERALAQPECNGKDHLESLTDRELFIFITAKTMIYGRSFKDSKANAACQIRRTEDRADVIKRFSRSKSNDEGRLI